jgi:hypothetical protein
MKLIDKNALVAEIEKLVDKSKYHEEYDCTYRDGNNGALYALKGRLDTLEVKEVDLEEELKHYCRDYYNCDYPKQLEEENCSEVMPHIVSAAKRFFELGLKAQKGENAHDSK